MRLDIRSAIGVVVFAALAASSSVLFAQTPAEQLKANFVEAFAAVDEDRLAKTYAALERHYPDDPELPCFAFELARLNSYAAGYGGASSEKRREVAEGLFRQFESDGRFVEDPLAERAQLEHARMLITFRQHDAASIIYRNLAKNCSTEIFLLVLDDAMRKLMISQPDVDFWRQAAEKRIQSIKNPPEELVFNLALLQDWYGPEVELQKLIQKAHATESLAWASFNTGSLDGPGYLEKAKTILDEFFEKAATEGIPASQRPQDVLALKFMLAQCEMWSNNNERADGLIDEILANEQPGNGHFIARVLFWKALLDSRRSYDQESTEKRIVEILNQGGARANLAANMIDYISNLALNRADHNAAEAYYWAYAHRTPSPARVLWARDKLMKFNHLGIKEDKFPPTALNLVFAEENALIEKDQQERAARTDLRGPQRFAAWREPLYRMSDLERKYAAVE